MTEIMADGGTSNAVGNKIATGPDGSVYMSNERNPRVDRIAPDGVLTLVAGTGTPAETEVVGDGGPATEAQFNRISDIAVDSQGVLYVSDEGQGVVRVIDPAGVISTVFGGGEIDVNQAPDGTAATDIRYGAAEIGIAVDAEDRLYVVIRLAAKVVRIADGKIETVAGGGRTQGPGLPRWKRRCKRRSGSRSIRMATC